LPEFDRPTIAGGNITASGAGSSPGIEGNWLLWEEMSTPRDLRWRLVSSLAMVLDMICMNCGHPRVEVSKIVAGKYPGPEYVGAGSEIAASIDNR
jgi:hypothetical protein